MQSASVGEIQKNFARVLKRLEGGEQIVVTKRGKPVAIIAPLRPARQVEWPDFYAEAIDLKGIPVSQILRKDREERI